MNGLCALRMLRAKRSRDRSRSLIEKVGPKLLVETSLDVEVVVLERKKREEKVYKYLQIQALGRSL